MFFLWLSIESHRGCILAFWGEVGLDNIFSTFCQIFLDKIKKILSNKSSLITYNFYLSIYLTGVVGR